MNTRSFARVAGYHEARREILDRLEHRAAVIRDVRSSVGSYLQEDPGRDPATVHIKIGAMVRATEGAILDVRNMNAPHYPKRKPRKGSTP